MLDRIELGALPHTPVERNASGFFYLLELFARVDATAAAGYVTSLLMDDPGVLGGLRRRTEGEIESLNGQVARQIDDHLPGGYSFGAELDVTGMDYSEYAIRPDPALFAATDELSGVLTFSPDTETARVDVLVDAVNQAFVVGEGETDLLAAADAIESLLGFCFTGTLRLTEQPHGKTVFTANLGLLASMKPGVVSWTGPRATTGTITGAR